MFSLPQSRSGSICFANLHLSPDYSRSLPCYLCLAPVHMGYLKGKSALIMFGKHANQKYKFGNRHFWSEGYYVSTVGMNEATIKKCVEEQEKHDTAIDKLSLREYEGPFKGSK